MEKKEYKINKELLDSLRDIDGFPIGEDDDIIALSDPPYYTAFPNPFIEDFIKQHGNPYDPKTDKYHREPFASDVSEGKNDPIYNAHTYPTKIPFKAIMRYILHYTNPGDIIFDGFCGSGMTGVAAQACEDNQNIIVENQKKGKRHALLGDISTIATFLSYCYNNPISKKRFSRLANRILKEVEEECKWMYETEHIEEGKTQINIKHKNESLKGVINYVVWSALLICPNCTHSFIFYEQVLTENNKVLTKFTCPKCDSILTRRKCNYDMEMIFDPILNIPRKKKKLVPVLICYNLINSKHKRKKYYKKLDKKDYELLNIIQDMRINDWMPIKKIMGIGEKWGDSWRAGYHSGIEYVHDFYFKRTLIILSKLYNKINQAVLEKEEASNMLLLLFTSQLINLSMMNRHRPNVSFPYNPLSGTLYISSLINESNVIIAYRNKIKRIILAIDHIKYKNIVSTQSNTNLKNILDNSIDYIFTDPPFGDNLMYSELNFLIESWLKNITNNNKEAIINSSQQKDINIYRKLIEQSFKENYRILKPFRWMTVVFHNSRNSVWIAVQEAITRAGFVVADVRILDKQQGTYKQVTSLNAVKQDLVISSYKPKFSICNQLEVKSDEHVWEFIRNHLKQLPIYIENKGLIEIINERRNYLLYDRMVAFFVQRGIAVPISASEFYAGLKERFPERDGMYFLHDQVAEYDSKRMKAKRLEQITIFIQDEKTAIQWLKNILDKKPQTYQEMFTEFTQNLFKQKHEELPELREILVQNFIQDEEGRWHVPDPNKDKDLEKLRTRALLNEYQEYTKTKGKLRVFRTEAVRAGFSHDWQNSDYESIVKVAEKIPTDVLQEDPTLLMYYDNALARRG